MRMTETQRRCIIEATIDNLVQFRRGFARSKQGPFFALPTVQNLIETGALRIVRDRSGSHYLKLTARAA
jgi:hypothetical protein